MKHDEVPVFPKITVTTHSDGTGIVSINGSSQTVSAKTAPEARAQVTAIVIEVAVKLGRPVKATTSGVDGEWPLVVHPDGTVEEDTSAPSPKKTRKSKGRKSRARVASEQADHVVSDGSAAPTSSESVPALSARVLPETAQRSKAEALVEQQPLAEPTLENQPVESSPPENESSGEGAPAPKETPPGTFGEPVGLPHEHLPPPTAPEERSVGATPPQVRRTSAAMLVPDPPPVVPVPGYREEPWNRPADTFGQVPPFSNAPEERRARSAQWWGEAIAEHNRSLSRAGTTHPPMSHGSDRHGRWRRLFSWRAHKR